MSRHASERAEQPLYRQVADRIEALICAGTLAPGDRIPSVRRLAAQMGVSVTTVLEAYRRLEDCKMVEARPKSGYYVLRACQAPVPARSETSPDPRGLHAAHLALSTLFEADRPDLVRFGAAMPDAALLPSARLGRLLARVAREESEATLAHGTPQGRRELRMQVARRLVDAGCTVTADDLLITNGAQEALVLALRAVTKPGDTVAVESPTYHGLLEAIDALHLKALEVATDPGEGVCLTELEAALKERSIAACAFTPTHGNPLGHRMPEESKRRLVEMLHEAGVALVEDDVYGDLPHGAVRPRAAKAFDEHGTVMFCSSFSKTLAPGFRVGWIVPGRWEREVALLKFSSSVATATAPQLAIARFLESGGYDRYLRSLRRTYRDLVQRFTATIAEHFPEGTAVTRPEGGHVLWIQMPAGVDSLELHSAALERGISIAAGPLFTAGDGYRNNIRLSCAVPWSARVEQALRELGGLVKERAARR